MASKETETSSRPTISKTQQEESELREARNEQDDAEEMASCGVGRCGKDDKKEGGGTGVGLQKEKGSASLRRENGSEQKDDQDTMCADISPGCYHCEQSCPCEKETADSIVCQLEYPGESSEEKCHKWAGKSS